MRKPTETGRGNVAALPEHLRSTQGYLERERRAEQKSEFLNGEIIAMAGASRAHNIITTSIASSLHARLQERPCETYTSDMRVRVQETGAYVHPDVVVVCGEPRFLDAQLDTLLNPTLVFEVLSPTTESYDLGLKLAHYRRLASLREFVALAQDRVYGQHWIRQPRGLWLVEDHTDIGRSLSLVSIGCDLDLAEVYSRVEVARTGGVDGSGGATENPG